MGMGNGEREERNVLDMDFDVRFVDFVVILVHCS